MTAASRHLRVAALAFLSVVPGAAIGAGELTQPVNDDMRVTLTGKVRMPDGAPAAGAIVASTDRDEQAPVIARADSAGRFSFRALYGLGARLHARTADGRLQKTLMISAPAVRSVSRSELTLTLAAAVAHEVTVVAEGRPVTGAWVTASGIAFEVHDATGPDGKVRLFLPADEPLIALTAWHPERGAGGLRKSRSRGTQNRTQLVLLRPKQLKIRVVDPAGEPVSGVELTASVASVVSEGSVWANVRAIDAARLRTNSEGIVTLSWAPEAGLRNVDVQFLGLDWKTDAIDLERLGDRLVTVKARCRLAVEGHLVMPQGGHAQGVLIRGFGFGPGERGDIPCARARADGSFTLWVPADHAYGLAVSDLDWASDIWAGVIFGTESSKPAEISIPVQRATPVTVRVTRGQEHTPVVGASVEVGTSGKLSWVDASGKKRSATPRMGSWLRTDIHGEAKSGAMPGKLGVRLSSGTWDQEQAVVVQTNTPVVVAFHREWPGERQLAGRLLSGGKPFKPSAMLVGRAWMPTPRGWVPDIIKVEVGSDGSFRVGFDAPSLTLFFHDLQSRSSAFMQVDRNVPNVALEMEPSARYRGTLVDDTGKAMAGQVLTLSVQGTMEIVASIQTDQAGRFDFETVPVNLPLALNVGTGATPPEYMVVANDRLFLPGEVRENDNVRPRRLGGIEPAAPLARPARPLADRIANICRDVRVAGMRALVILKGDASPRVTVFTGEVLHDELVPAVLNYLPIVVEPGELKAEAAVLTLHGWPAPEPGQIVLAVLDGERLTMATRRIAAEPADAALATADAFLRQHKPPTRDAIETVTGARDAARKTGRRVWIVHGGPRCGPCFRLGRWMDEHHDALDRDFVVAKVMGGLDAHADQVLKELPEIAGNGIPWHAITEPDGTILVTSDGPAGNIGCPVSIEDLRHFRRMLEKTVRKLTASEVDGLVTSLSDKK
jgi:hypothetical protein